MHIIMMRLKFACGTLQAPLRAVMILDQAKEGFNLGSRREQPRVRQPVLIFNTYVLQEAVRDPSSMAPLLDLHRRPPLLRGNSPALARSGRHENMRRVFNEYSLQFS